MDKQNVTLSLPVPLLRKLRVAAARRNTSMSGLMENAIQKLLETDDDYDIRAKRMIERMRNAPARGIGGKITSPREELHDRIR